MDGGDWWAAVHGIAKSQTRLSDFTFTFHFHALEKEMATHSSVLSWRILGTGEPSGQPSMGSQSQTGLKRFSSSSRGSLKKQELQKSIYFCFIGYTKAFDCVHHNKLWKTLKEMGIPGHLTCCLRNLYAGQEATVRTGHGTMEWFQIGKGVHQGCILSPCLFNLDASYKMPGKLEFKKAEEPEIKLPKSVGS